MVERADYPPQRIKEILGKETVAVLGYSVRGRGQFLDMKDNGVTVIIGLRGKRGRSWDLAQQDGWVPGKTLFSLEEATQRGTIVQYLLSDAGQKEQWPTIKPYLTEVKALYFSHGFTIAYQAQTGVVPPKKENMQNRGSYTDFFKASDIRTYNGFGPLARITRKFQK